MEAVNRNIEWYIKAIQHELELLEKGRFMGHIEFKLHLKDGKIGNMFVLLNKSIKHLIK